MKRGWKWILMIALSIAGVGLVFCIAGTVMGGTMEEVNEILGTTEFVKTIDEKIVTITDDGHSEHSYIGESSEHSHIGETSGEIYENIEKLDVEVPVMEVVVQESDRENVSVAMQNVPEKLRNAISVSRQGDELKIETKEDSALKNWLKTGGDYGILVIELPYGMRLTEASFQIGAGELNVQNISAEELDIEVGAGTVSVAQFMAEKADVQCGTGEAELSGSISQEINIECGVGSVIFHDSGKESDYEYDLSCGIGSLQVGEHSYDGLGGSEKIKNAGGSKKMQIECGIGEVAVFFSQDE